MGFVSRLVNYVVNELLVDALANNKSFQRFAVRSDALMKNQMKDASEKIAKAVGGEKNGVGGNDLGKYAEDVKVAAGKFFGSDEREQRAEREGKVKK